MKIDSFIRLITIMPRNRRDAITTTQIVDLYYKGVGKSVKEMSQTDSKMRRVQKYMEELVEMGMVTHIKQTIPGRKSPLNLYHLRENQVLSYFLHNKAALNLLWARGLAPQLDQLAGPDDVWGLAEDARLSKREGVLRDQVRIVPDGVGREFAKIVDSVLPAVSEAMEAGYQVKVTIEHSSGAVVEYEVTVLGLVAKDGAIYMLTVMGFEDKPKHYPLHRVRKAEVIRVRAFTRSEFRIDQYIREQHQLAHLRHDEQSPIDLDLLVAEEALFHFRERPFMTVSGEQVISATPVHGKWYSVKATVPYTVMLAPFLWSHAGWVQVLGPETIRQRVAEGVLAAAMHYQIAPPVPGQ